MKPFVDPLPIYRKHASGLTCIHASQVLCPMCDREYQVDALAYLEFGDHAAGLRNWKRLEESIREHTEECLQDPPADAGDIPF